MRVGAWFVAALLLHALGPAAARATPDGSWERVNYEDGVEVHRKEVPGSPLVAFRGSTIIEAPVDRILWVLVDNAHKTEWVDMCSESRVLEEVSPFEMVIYQSFALPWYLSDRDYVYTARATREASGAVRLHIASVEHQDAPETIGVRARLIESSYTLTPLDPRRTRVEVEIHTDPMGMVPSWLVNMVQAGWPVRTLAGVRAQVRRDHVGSYPLPPVSEPVAQPTLPGRS